MQSSRLSEFLNQIQKPRNLDLETKCTLQLQYKSNVCVVSIGARPLYTSNHFLHQYALPKSVGQICMAFSQFLHIVVALSPLGQLSLLIAMFVYLCVCVLVPSTLGVFRSNYFFRCFLFQTERQVFWDTILDTKRGSAFENSKRGIAKNTNIGSAYENSMLAFPKSLLLFVFS